MCAASRSSARRRMLSAASWERRSRRSSIGNCHLRKQDQDPRSAQRLQGQIRARLTRRRVSVGEREATPVSFKSWPALRAAAVVLVNVVLAAGLLVLAELVLHRVYDWKNPLLDNGETRLRVHHPVFTHTLRAKFDGYDKWGPANSRVVTNSLGFKDASTRNVPLVADRRRVVFIGDSFTEGVGVAYEESFVGRFAQAFPAIGCAQCGRLDLCALRLFRQAEILSRRRAEIRRGDRLYRHFGHSGRSDRLSARLGGYCSSASSRGPGRLPAAAGAARRAARRAAGSRSIPSSRNF